MPTSIYFTYKKHGRVVFQCYRTFIYTEWNTLYQGQRRNTVRASSALHRLILTASPHTVLLASKCSNCFIEISVRKKLQAKGHMKTESMILKRMILLCTCFWNPPRPSVL